MENSGTVWTVVEDHTLARANWPLLDSFEAANQDAAQRNARAEAIGVSVRYTALPIEQLKLARLLLAYHRSAITVDWRPDYLTPEDHLAA